MDYLFLKWIHVLSSTILFGAGVGSAFHLFASTLRRRVAGVASGTRNVVVADWLLTTPTAILQPVTGIVSLGVYPVEDSLALLARVGLHGVLATLALFGAALLDLVLGVLTVAAPARWRRWVWLAQLALIGGYTVLITFFLPEYWLHPYGPISKTLPILAVLGLLWALEPPARRER